MEHNLLNSELDKYSKNFNLLHRALKDYYIKQGFRGRKTKFERRGVVCKCHPSKYIQHLQRFRKCFHIKILYSIHIYEGLVKNSKVTVGQIAREYKNKLIGDPKIIIGSLVDDLRTMYGVEVDP